MLTFKKALRRVDNSFCFLVTIDYGFLTPIKQVQRKGKEPLPEGVKGGVETAGRDHRDGVRAS